MSRYKRRHCKKTGKTVYLHRAMAAWRLGRELRPGEVTHHRNGDREDSHPDNLVVLPSQRAHALLHWYERREAKGVQHLWSLATWLELHR
jgi:hypothetical protein